MNDQHERLRAALRQEELRQTCRCGHSYAEHLDGFETFTNRRCRSRGCGCARFADVERATDTSGMEKQKPSIGRIVHYYPNGDTTPQAALVIAVDSDEVVKVQACNAGGTWNTRTSVPFDETPGATRERWCWPPRV